MKVTVKCTCGCSTTLNTAPFDLKENFYEQSILAYECLACHKKIAIVALDMEKYNILPRENIK